MARRDLSEGARWRADCQPCREPKVREAIIAVAVNEDGKREVLGVATGASEAEAFWTEFLRSPADRGLRGVKRVIADDHKGLRAAARHVCNATHQ